MNLSSLRGKISTAYLAIVFITIILGVLSLLDLQFVERQVAEGETVSSLKDALLEMRRNEKNLFLYADHSVWREAEREAVTILHIMDSSEDLLIGLSSSTVIGEARRLLQSYRENLSRWSQSSDDETESIERELRDQGHAIGLIIRQIYQQERLMLKEAIRESRWFFFAVLTLIGLSIYLVGHQLVKHAVSPLKKLERQMTPLVQGRFAHLTPPSRDREFITLTDAFNHMLKELEIRQKRMMHSEKLASLGILASGVAHELNNPLSNISTSCQLLTEELDEADHDQLRTWLRQIDSETERGRRIVSALLDYGRQKDFATSHVSLLQIINDTQVMIRKLLRQSLVQLQINVAEEIQVQVDPQRIQQLLINIVQNAINAGGEQTHVIIEAETFDPRTETVPEDAEVIGNTDCLEAAKGHFIKLSVSDDGPGISEENLAHVFDPFFTTNEPGHGVGLGLYIVREIINEHDGCLSITSHPGRGTRVNMLLPAAEADDQEIAHA